MKQTTKAPLPPCILGIVTADMLAARRYPETLWACDGVELRADGLAPGDIPPAMEAFRLEKTRRGFTGPVVFTLRLQRDGGAWPDAGAPARNPVWASLPSGTCDWVDLEIEEITRPGRIPPQTMAAFRAGGMKILLSHHAFAFEEASSWDAILSDMRALEPDGVKFAVTPRGDQMPELLELARRVGDAYPESCVLGMGADAAVSRVLGPLLGCPFTYGFLGDGAVAPGQLDVGTLRRFFAAAPSGLAPADASDEALLRAAATLLAKVRGA